jgi:hypothetical protein
MAKYKRRLSAGRRAGVDRRRHVTGVAERFNQRG